MRRAAHNGCCRRVAQTRALCSALWKLLVSEDLAEVLMGIEVPLVSIYEALVYLEACLMSILHQFFFKCNFYVLYCTGNIPIKIK